MPSQVNHTYINTSHSTASSVSNSIVLSNEAHQLQARGDLSGAEQKFLSALNLKIQSTGEKSIQTGVTRNALGELYMEMGKIDEAELNLNEALEIRKKLPNFDTAVTRENLGQLWEIKGDLGKAREVRNQGAPNSMACGNPNCPGEMYKKTDLLACGRCNSVYYHDKACQRRDWARHKKYCKAA